MYAGRTQEANEAFRYLNPALATSSRLFGELNRDPEDLQRFVVETAKLVGDTAERGDDIAGVISNMAATSTALAAQKASLSEAIGRLPDFMRKANTTFLNLRGALDDLDPLVAASRPVARRLRPLLADLRPFARDAVPATRDLSRTIRADGEGNDLIDLLRAQPALDRAANDPVDGIGARRRQGAFPVLAKALEGGTPQVAFGRPYTLDLQGWFDDFSTSGMYDALGSFSRAGLGLNGFTFGPGLNLLPVPDALRDEVLGADLKAGRNNRCPGSAERDPGDGSLPFRPSPDFNCDPSQVPIGP